jgi:hypothetical protein
MSTVAEVIESVEPEGRRVDRSASVPYEGDMAVTSSPPLRTGLAPVRRSVMYFFRMRTKRRGCPLVLQLADGPPPHFVDALAGLVVADAEPLRDGVECLAGHRRVDPCLGELPEGGIGR